MNWKPTLILLLVAGALYAFFTLYENKQPGTREAAQNANRIYPEDRGLVDGLTLTDHDSRIELTRASSNHWSMKSPVADRADGTLIDQLFTALEGTRKEDTIAAGDVSKAKLAEYGLQNPRARLLITPHTGKPTELLFGNETALDGKTYLQIAGQKSVLVVTDDLKKLLDKGPDAWRDHRLTDLVATEVNRLTVKNPAGELELQREGEHWKIVKPLAARADDAKVNDLVARVTNLSVAGFTADDKADAAGDGLAQPRGAVTLYTAKDAKGSEILIGNAPAPKQDAATPAPAPPPAAADGGLVYVRMPARQTVYTVPKDVEAFVGLKPGDLRDRQLVRLNPDTVDRLRVTPAEGQPFTLARKDKAWTLLPVPPGEQAQPANGAEAERLMQALNAAQVADFTADGAPDFPKYGLDKPALQLAFSALASGNTAETAAGEKPVAVVSFGQAEGGNVYARLNDEPSVVAVDKTLLAAIPSSPVQWQPLAIFNADPQKLTSLEVQPKSQSALKLTRPDKGGAWELADKAAGALDEAKANGLASALARLHALRWAGEVKPEYGLDAPLQTLAFAAGADAKAGGQLFVGPVSPDGLAYARAEGKPGAFSINRADFDALTQPLVPSQAAPAATVPPPVATPEPVPVAPVPLPAAVTPSPAPPAATPPPLAASIPEAMPTPAPTATPEPPAAPVPSTPAAASTPPVEAVPPSAPAPMATPADIPVPPPVAEPAATPAAQPMP